MLEITPQQDTDWFQIIITDKCLDALDKVLGHYEKIYQHIARDRNAGHSEHKHVLQNLSFCPKYS